MRKIPTVDSWTKAKREIASPILHEVSPFDVDGGEIIGRDPRKITVAEFDQAGIAGAPLLDVIRAKCLDCSNEQSEEVRKCVAYSCANWPYRMGSNPFRAVNLTEEELEKRRARGRALAAKRNAVANQIDQN